MMMTTMMMMLSVLSMLKLLRDAKEILTFASFGAGPILGRAAGAEHNSLTLVSWYCHVPVLLPFWKQGKLPQTITCHRSKIQKILGPTNTPVEQQNQDNDQGGMLGEELVHQHPSLPCQSCPYVCPVPPAKSTLRSFHRKEAFWCIQDNCCHHHPNCASPIQVEHLFRTIEAL